MGTNASTDLFEDKPEVFVREIYENALGQLRVEGLVSDLEAILPQHSEIVSILDIGSGYAPVTLELLRRRPYLNAHLVDPSQELLSRADQLRQTLGIDPSRVKFSVGNLEWVLSHRSNTQANLILCHAVANWVHNPMKFIGELLDLCTDDSLLSLVVGASFGKVFRFAMQGNLDEALTITGRSGASVSSLLGEEKVQPLDPETVQAFIGEAGFEFLLNSGVRVVADYVPRASLEDPNKLKQLQELENRLRHHPQFWKFGQLVHFIIRRGI